MDPDSASAWTIRNQRVRGWPNWLVSLWCFLWAPTGSLASRIAPEWATFAMGCAIVFTIVPVWVFLARTYHSPRILRLKLGDDLRAYPGKWRLRPMAITSIRVSHDPDEDYAEAKLPVPLCRVVIEAKPRRRFVITATSGDAARVAEWGRKKGIAITDPEGLANRPTTGSTRDD